SVVDFIEGGVSTLGADAQLIRCYCLTAEENSGQCRQENCLVAFHRYCSFLWLDMNCLQRSEWGLSNTCSGVPISSTCPWCKNITWLETWRAKPISWVTNSIVRPSSASARITMSTSWTISGSSAEVGS